MFFRNKLKQDYENVKKRLNSFSSKIDKIEDGYTYLYLENAKLKRIIKYSKHGEVTCYIDSYSFPHELFEYCTNGLEKTDIYIYENSEEYKIEVDKILYDLKKYQINMDDNGFAHVFVESNDDKSYEFIIDYKKGTYLCK